MYSLNLKRTFTAQHFLTVPGCGAENEWHSHVYGLEVRLEGEALDANGYLVDIVDVEARLGRLVDRYRDHTLNDMPEFEGLNPSIEHFARILCEALVEGNAMERLRRVTVRVHEDDVAWASYTRDLSETPGS